MLISHHPQSLAWGGSNLGERQVCHFTQFLGTMHCTVYTRICGSCWGNQVFFPCLEGLVHFNEAQTGIFIFLSPILASESNPPVFFPQSPSWLYGPGLYLVPRKIRNVHRWDSSSQPSCVHGWAVSAQAYGWKNMCFRVRSPDSKPNNDILYSFEQDI